MQHDNMLSANFHKYMLIEDHPNIPGTILLEILISWCAPRHDDCHTFCRLFVLNLQVDPHHQPLGVQIQRQRDHALHSVQSIASKA